MFRYSQEDWNHSTGKDATLRIWVGKLFAKLTITYYRDADDLLGVRKNYYTWCWRWRDAVPYGRTLIYEWRKSSRA